jgi:tetratricopeptide (TPR) repeat protein
MKARLRRLAWMLPAAACAFAGCKSEAPAPSTAAPPSGPVAEGRALLEQGQPDAALARLQDAPDDPESQVLQGRAWARKAESAPLPTPPPVAGDLPRGVAPPAAPEFKAEELQALALYEKAVAGRPDMGAAHLGIAELLAPHAIRRFDQQREAAAARSAPRRRRGKAPEPAPVAPAGDSQGVDYSIERVVRAYEFAAGSEDTGRAAADGLITFGTRVGRLDAAESGFRHLLERVKENPEPFIRYGNFLVEQKKDGDAAIEQYRQALIWKSDDESTRLRIASIYLARGKEHFDSQQFAVAEAEFKQAAKWVAPGSPQAEQLRSYQNLLREIRKPVGRQ